MFYPQLFVATKCTYTTAASAGLKLRRCIAGLILILQLQKREATLRQQNKFLNDKLPHFLQGQIFVFAQCTFTAVGSTDLQLKRCILGTILLLRSQKRKASLQQEIQLLSDQISMVFNGDIYFQLQKSTLEVLMLRVLLLQVRTFYRFFSCKRADLRF